MQVGDSCLPKFVSGMAYPEELLGKAKHTDRCNLFNETFDI